MPIVIVKQDFRIWKFFWDEPLNVDYYLIKLNIWQ